MSSVKEIQSVRNCMCASRDASPTEQPIGVSELARAHRHRQERRAPPRRDAPRRGWLAPTAEGRWRIAPALWHPACSRPSADSLVERSRPCCERLRDETGETAMLVAVERGGLLVLDVADSPHALRITAPVGSELPHPNSSALRAIAAHAHRRRARAPAPHRSRPRRMQPSPTPVERGWAINDERSSPTPASSARRCSAPTAGPSPRSSCAHPRAASTSTACTPSGSAWRSRPARQLPQRTQQRTESSSSPHRQSSPAGDGTRARPVQHGSLRTGRKRSRGAKSPCEQSSRTASSASPREQREGGPPAFGCAGRQCSPRAEI